MAERRYDPELASIIPLLPVESDWSDMPAARTAMTEMISLATAGSSPPDGVTWDDRHVPGLEGRPEISVRVYRPPVITPVAATVGARVGALLYLHGGGFCLGDVETEHLGAAGLAARLRVVVVSVDYRLAPEDPYPAGIDDCYGALCWLASAVDELGVDPARIAVMGQSAGGGLAAATALRARDEGGPELCFQVLGIPELDDRLETPSMQQFTDTPLWNRPNAIESWRAYLGDAAGGPDVPADAAPARATDLSGLPPAFVTTMEFDPLRDEGILYALGLLQAGVSVELHQYPGTFHGSALVTTADVSQRDSAALLAALARALT